VFNWIANLFASKPASSGRAVRIVRARYDAASTNPDNRRHWANADGLSANAANSAEVRRVLRNRARYETANNSYARGITLTLANDVVGTGPRLQLLTSDATANNQLEHEFQRWARSIGLAEKLRTMRMARATDGEVFAVLTSNSALATTVQLDLRLLEADQVATPDLNPLRASSVDGIVFDDAGNPVEYHVLRQHPGETAGGLNRDYDRFPAAAVIHWFRVDRPGQARGIPDIMPALPLFAQLRRFTLAVLAAAETAADFAGILYTDAPANGEADAAEPFEPIELEKRALLTMPGGWKMSQMEAEQPATTYGEFKREILNEIARCLNMPAKKGVQEAGLWITTRFPRVLLGFASAFFVESQDHRVFGTRGAAATDDEQVVVSLVFVERSPQLRESLSHALHGVFEFVLVLAVRFKTVDGPLHLAERASPADRGGKQPEEPADLCVVTQVDALAHAPGNSRIVLVAADARILGRARCVRERLVASLDRRLAASDLATGDLTLCPRNGPVVNLGHRHRSRFLLRKPRQLLPVLPVLGRVESVRREIGLHLALRFLNLFRQFGERPLLLGMQRGKFRLDQSLMLVRQLFHGVVEGGEHATDGLDHLVMRYAELFNPRSERPQSQRSLGQRLLRLGIVGDGGHERLAGLDRSFLPVLVHGDDVTPSNSAKRNHSIASPSMPKFPPSMLVP